MSLHSIGIKSAKITCFLTFFDVFYEILAIAFIEKMNILAIRAGYED
jgi:hypothetical protein